MRKTVIDSHIFEIEHEEGPGNWVLHEYEVDVDYDPYDPGRCSGPPELCEPPSGGGAEYSNVRRRKFTPPGEENNPWEGVPHSVFLEAYAHLYGLKDDEKKTALDQAEENANDQLYMACEEAAEAEAEMAAEARGNRGGGPYDDDD